jgi:hypothetical protein
MNPPAPEVVRIGIAGAHISSVSRQRIEYVDEAGQERFVDLEQCARNWVRYRNDHEQDFCLLPGASAESAAKWNSRCVGQRDALDDPPWVEFMNERHTRFQFASYQAVYALLLDALDEAGWRTFDAG